MLLQVIYFLNSYKAILESLNIRMSVLNKKVSPGARKIIFYKFYFSETNPAIKYSLFKRAIFSIEISFGQTASHAPVFVQPPKPSLSICATIFKALVLLSGSPCGNKARCVTFAETKSIAEEFLHAATQAPQPIHAAAAKEVSAFSLSTGSEFASTAFPVFTEIKPPACIILSNEVLSTIRSLITGNAFALHGSTTIVSPSWKALMCNWQVVVACHGPCGRPLIYIEHMPQIPSRQS